MEKGGSLIMAKRTYETPEVEVVSFNYQDQVVAYSNPQLGTKWVVVDGGDCKSDDPVPVN
jgi:hypothetical protein